MRLVFAGTPDAAVPSLCALAAAGHDIPLVLTRTDAPVGRKRTLTPSPVAQAAETLGLRVHRTDRLDAATTALVAETAPDLGVIVAYGGLVREPLLSLPVHGWINLHFSLLPRWRGAAPVQHAVLAADNEIGAGVFQLGPGLDDGPVFDEIRMRLEESATAGGLLSRLSEDGAVLLREVIDAIGAGSARSVAQRGEPTFAPKLSDADGAVDWDQERRLVQARINAMTPTPGAHTTFDGARLKVLEVRTVDPATPPLPPGHLRALGRGVIVGTGSAPLELVRVQPAGKQAMAAADWWRGLRVDTAVVGG
ncbi:methionyl-tRNA formyltransferase [Microbacterium sediminicola]|uniref:Methionyl-tRNA formyltransferase n=1 Tax=Microbacterium sediminicola TaxID=415210 RepID=A0ABN2HUP4_9MICO